MIFKPTKLEGAFVIELEKLQDHRGFFARAFCKKEFEIRNMRCDFVQCNIAYNRNCGTLRGLHFQATPFDESKLVQCTRGSVYDVIIDLRPKSTTYKHWFGIELSADNRRMLYIPEGFAHGYLTLMDDTELFYQVTQFYSPEHEQGIRWDDRSFSICWPKTDGLIISKKDQNLPNFGDPR